MIAESLTPKPGIREHNRGKPEFMSIDLSAFDAAASHWIRLVGTCIEIFGVFILVAGIAWSTYRYVGWPTAHHYDQYRIRIGRSLLLGLEVLVAADIVKTVAIDLTFTSLGLLAGLVLVRTFLSWTLVLEIEGHWPWRRQLASVAVAGDPGTPAGGGESRDARHSRR